MMDECGWVAHNRESAGVPLAISEVESRKDDVRAATFTGRCRWDVDASSDLHLRRAGVLCLASDAWARDNAPRRPGRRIRSRVFPAIPGIWPMPRTVLIVDDERDTNEMLAAMVQT